MLQSSYCILCCAFTHIFDTVSYASIFFKDDILEEPRIVHSKHALSTKVLIFKDNVLMETRIVGHNKCVILTKRGIKTTIKIKINFFTGKNVID